VQAARDRLLRLMRVSSMEQLIKKVLRLVFWIALLVPLVLLPAFYFVYTMI
jgi:hypothetical protein